MVILFDRYHLPEDIFEVIFATKQQKIVGKLLIAELKIHDGELNKSEMSFFATKLHEGNVYAEIDEPEYKGKTVKLSYNKRQFYDRILTPFRSMGMIDYDMYEKKYKLSKNFKKSMFEIGIMWDREVDKPAQKLSVKLKDTP
jgi:hypothetical protein